MIRSYVMIFALLSSVGVWAAQGNLCEGLGLGVGSTYKLLTMGTKEQPCYVPFAYTTKIDKKLGEVFVCRDISPLRGYLNSVAENTGASSWLLTLKYHGITMLSQKTHEIFFWPLGLQSAAFGPLGKIVVAAVAAKTSLELYRTYNRSKQHEASSSSSC